MTKFICSKARESFETRAFLSTLNPSMNPAFRKYSDCLKVNAQASTLDVLGEQLLRDVLSSNMTIRCAKSPGLGRELPFDIVMNINEDEGQSFWTGSF